MKKSVLMLAAALPMMFAACGTEDPEEGFNLETTTLEINYEGNANIETNVKGCTFVSDNEFIASVDKDGKVTANHVGEAKITVAYEGERRMQGDCKTHHDRLHNAGHRLEAQPYSG